MKPNDSYYQCQCCKECNDCYAGFQKILELKNTGLVIYRHTTNSEDVNEYVGVIEVAAKPTEEVFILHNTKNNDIASADYLQEIEINAIPYTRCRKIVENAQKLLEKGPTINRNDVKGICEHCRMKAMSCIECKEVVKKFVANKNERTENTTEKVKQWLSKVKCLLKDSVNDMGSEKVRARSELHIDELCRHVLKPREPEVNQMFHDVTDFCEAFSPSIEKRKNMFAHILPSEKPKRPVLFIDQPEMLGKPSSSRLNLEFNIQDHDKGYYSDVDSEDMRTMFHPALTNEEKKRKSIKEHIPTVPFQSEEDFIAGNDDANTTFENVLRQTPESYRSGVDLGVTNKDFAQASKVSQKSELPGLHHKAGEPSLFIRRIHSEETLLSKDTNVTGVLKPNFSFVFPNKLSPDIENLKRQKSSSELIKDTQDMLLAKADKEKKIQEAEQIRKLEEEMKKRITLKEKRKELAVKKADEERRKHLEVRNNLEHVREIKSDTYKKETAKINEKDKILQRNLTILKKGETKIGTGEMDSAFVRDEIEKKSKRKVATKELENKRDIEEKDNTKAEKQIRKKFTPPKELEPKIETGTTDKAKKGTIDKQNKEKLTLQKTTKDNLEESEPKERTELRESKEPIELGKHEELKSHKETEEPKEIKVSQATMKHLQSKEIKLQKESKKSKESEFIKEPKVEESEQTKSPKEIKESKELKDLKESKELKSPKELNEPSKDKKALQSNKYDDKFKKDLEGKLQKEEREISKKEKDEQRWIENENKEKEKEFSKRAKHDFPKEKDKTVELKQNKSDSLAKQKELEDKIKQEKLVADKKEIVDAEVPPPITVKMEKIKVHRLSPDDLILRLVRLKQSTAARGDKSRFKRLSDMVSGKGVKMYQKPHADANNMCKASDIDFELLDLSQQKEEKKTAVIIGDKIFIYKKPTQTLRQDFLMKEKKKKISRQEICELARQKMLKKEIEEAEVKKQKLDKARLEKEEAEKSERQETGLSYMKHVNLDSIKVRRPSPDDLILQLVRLKQSTGGRTERTKPKRLADTKIARKDGKIHKKHKTRARVLSKDTDSEPESERPDELKKENEIAEIIIGQKISKYKPSMGERQNVASAPSFVQSTFDTNQESVQAKEVESSVHISGKEADHESTKGVIRYALSDRTFIEKGWTMLPTEKVVRKMNVYRMRPAHPEFDWFEHNKDKGMMQYDTGEKLAEFDDEGRGRWFYRNGRMALDYYDAEELNAQQRFVIYSSGEPDERGRAQPYTLLATFDYLGNGVVFDHSGKIRLKYNQTEGVVLDRSIGPVSHWKWHTLNDPPVLQQVMIDTQMTHKDPSILKLGGALDDRNTRPDNEDMLAIEFDNFIKEKSKKLTQSFKPFQIKMKALKINEQFSLRVLDQATVYLLFRDGTTNLKLNIGMVLDHKEIVDTDTAEVGEVSTNMERLPARTESLAGLQRSVAHAERYERLRTERELKIRPFMPRASADKLVSAASQPMRAPLRLRTGQSSTTTTDSSCKCSRKPTASNIYYDTRLC